jgi:exosortase family protein XrtM
MSFTRPSASDGPFPESGKRDGPCAPERARPTYRSWLKFVVLFAIVFGAGTKAHEAMRARLAPFLVGTLTVRPSAALINLITPSEGTKAVGNLLKGQVTIRVGQGCDGIDCLLLLIAAVLAFPTTWRAKPMALAAGVPLIYTCNLVRIAALYHVQRHAPLYFDLMHAYVGQTVIIIVGCGFFLFWVRSLARTE